MERLLDQIGIWFEQGRSVALATVIKTWGSSPRPAGSMMAISDQGEIYGSVSGGCVEGAVIDAAMQVIVEGTTNRLHFGVTNEEAWEVGLSCGGEIEVFVRGFYSENLKFWRDATDLGERFSIALAVAGNESYLGRDWCIYEGGPVLHGPSMPTPSGEFIETIKETASKRISALIVLDQEGIQEVFLHTIDPPRQLILVGGVHIAIPLSSLAETLGFQVIVIDPRRLFGNSERFPAVKELLQVWPQEAFQKITITESTAVVMLTHDPKIDDPAIQIALESPAFYIGALGSKKTHRKRLNRLLAVGFGSDKLTRIHAPVGLDLGASSPEEIALAVLAEIIQVWHYRK